MSHKIDSKDPLQKPCGCNTHDVIPSKLDIAIAEYKAMKEEAEAARDKFMQAALDLNLEPCTDEEVYEMFEENNH